MEHFQSFPSNWKLYTERRVAYLTAGLQNLELSKNVRVPPNVGSVMIKAMLHSTLNNPLLCSCYALNLLPWKFIEKLWMVWMEAWEEHIILSKTETYSQKPLILALHVSFFQLKSDQYSFSLIIAYIEICLVRLLVHAFVIMQTLNITCLIRPLVTVSLVWSSGLVVFVLSAAYKAVAKIILHSSKVFRSQSSHTYQSQGTN